MYGLYPRKGSIMIGADADIVLWDADKAVTLTDALMQHCSDHTPYEGMEVTGWPAKTLLRGALIADHGRIVGRPGTGSSCPARRHGTRTRRLGCNVRKSKPGASNPTWISGHHQRARPAPSWPSATKASATDSWT
jgi:Amidohydrolase family